MNSRQDGKRFPGCLNEVQDHRSESDGLFIYIKDIYEKPSRFFHIRYPGGHSVFSVVTLASNKIDIP